MHTQKEPRALLKLWESQIRFSGNGERLRPEKPQRRVGGPSGSPRSKEEELSQAAAGSREGGLDWGAGGGGGFPKDTFCPAVLSWAQSDVPIGQNFLPAPPPLFR